MSAGKGDRNRTSDLNAYRSSLLWNSLSRGGDNSELLNRFNPPDNKLNHMKAYKATYNLKCRDHQFEINETYQSDTLEICESGFHFCKEMLDTLNYYDFNNEFVLLEVEILGDTQYEGNKGVTDKLKVLRIIPEEEWTFMTRNEKGNRVVNFKNSCGFEWWIEYDVDGNETYYKDSAGYGYWREYDENGNGNVKYRKDSNGI